MTLIEIRMKFVYNVQQEVGIGVGANKPFNRMGEVMVNPEQPIEWGPRSSKKVLDYEGFFITRTDSAIE